MATTDTNTRTAETVAETSDRSGLVIWVVASAYFMLNLDGTVIVTALPAMAAGFGVTEIDLSIGITAYMMALAAFVPLGGWLAERYGSRRILAGAILVFTLASLACAVAPNVNLFVVARVIQGLGGALMFPVGRLLVLRNTPNSGMLRAISAITWPALIAPVIGPVIGGVIVTYASWHWIFLLNLPIGIAGAALVLIAVPDDKGAERVRLDVLGLALSSSSLLLLIYALETFSHREGNWALAAGVAFAGLALGTAAIRHLKRTPAPLFGLGPVRDPVFSITSLGSGNVLRTAINTAPFLLPLMFQLGFGLSPIDAGTLVLAYFAGNLAMKSATSPILKRFGFRNVILVNGALGALALLAFAGLGTGTPLPLTLAVLFAGGLFRSMQFTALNTLGFVGIAAEERASATTLWSMSQQISNCLGVALASLALSASLALNGRTVPETVDFRWAFAVIGVVGLVAVLRLARLPRDVGKDITG